MLKQLFRSGTCDIIRRDYMTLEDDIIQMDILVNYSGFHSKK
jgi:hypothetical protein